MGLLLDIHVHTRLHSPCSDIDPEALIRQAVKVGLDGLVITEHGYQWRQTDLDDLVDRSAEPNFLLLAGFEYTSRHGDMLIYGLSAEQADAFVPGLPPEDALDVVHDLGAVCVAAHPTRFGMGFDERLVSLPFDAIETQSGNLQEHEQRLAAQLASSVGIPAVAASDAHQLHSVGRYVTEFADPIQSMADLQDSLRRGTFRPVGCSRAETRTG